MSKSPFTILQTYVHFDVRDYTGNSVLTSYSLEQTPLTFIPDFTTSDLLSSARSVSNKVIKWSFGDSTFSNDLTAVHTYPWPGKYTVTLTVYDKYGAAYESRYKPTVFIEDFIPTYIGWNDYGKLIYDVPASRIGDPLVITTRNSWQGYNVLSAGGITINLYASGAGGEYSNPANFDNDKWSHLRILSRFYEKETYGNVEQYTVVDYVTAKTTEIYARPDIATGVLGICDMTDSGSIFVGTTGSNEIFYVDDKVKNYSTRENPIILFAKFDSAKFHDEFSQRRNIYEYIDYPPYSFENYAPAVFPLVKTRHNPADRISITTTGIDGEGTLSTTVFNIPEISWQGTEIPFVAKFKDVDGFTTKTYDPLSSSTTGTILSSISAYNVQFGIVYNNNGVQTPLNNVKFYDDFSAEIPQSIGGFFKGYFVASEAANLCTLTAQCVVVDPVNYPKDSLIGWIALPQYNYAMRLFKEQLYSSCTGAVTMTLTSRELFKPTDAKREIFSICIAPSGSGKSNDYQAWLADVATDTIFKVDSLGNTLSTVHLSSAPTLNNKIISYVDYRSNVMPGVIDLYGASPSNIALDGNSDLWVALYDSAKTIKIDGINGFVTAVAMPPTPNHYYLLSSYGTDPLLKGFVGEGVLLPGSVDTDIENNIWVSFTHPLSNFIVKYDTFGDILNIIPFPNVISPIEICADRNRKVWITAYNHNVSGATLSGRNDFLYRYDYDGNLDPGFPLSGFKMLNNITIDSKQNAWVSQDRETITKIDSFTLNKTDYIAGSGLNQTSYICSIVGLACDTSDYIWVINDYEKQIYVIDTQIDPKPYFNYIGNAQLGFPQPSSKYPVSAYELQQFQAYGDWYGQRWINKYMVPYTVTRTITGESNTFNIYSSAGEIGVVKINEGFNAKDFYKSLRYQEILLDKHVFFDQFLGGIVGGDGQPYELGKTVYEKIANFVGNKADISVCNLDTLISFCQELSIQFDQYNYPFPPQVRRLVDLLSIKQKNLFGDINTFNENFDPMGSVSYNGYNGVNLGTEISVITGSINSGNQLIAYEKFSETYTLVNFSGIPGYTISETIPLSTFSYNWGWGLVAPPSVSGIYISNYYRFYTFVEAPSSKFFNNVIDWYSPHTTISPYNSSYSDWTQDNGTMQNLLSYELTKGLRLFTSATDLTYNN
jgi:hypothetical protein